MSKKQKKPEVEKKVTIKKPIEKKVEKKKEEDLGTIGTAKIKISKLGKKVVYGVEYNDIHLINGCTMLLSNSDLKKQRNI